jgi:chitin biosynthesis protein CHS5
VVLEWDPVELATAELRSLSLYRNNSKAGNIPPGKLSTKISGLAVDTEYTFHLVLRTSAGQFSSERVHVRTHKMTDLHGITVTPGIMPPPLRDSLAETVNKIGAKLIDQVRIDTTHFVCTEPRGPAWDKAVEMNIPVVVPDWVKGCEREGRMVPARSYYLDADPSKRQIGPSAAERASVSSTQQVRESPRIEHTPPTPERATHEHPAAENGGDTAPADAPAPPPKPASERLAEESATEEDGESIAGTTLAERSKPAEDDEHEDGDGEDDDSEETEKGQKSTSDEKKASTEDDAEEGDEEKEGKFDDVAL